MGFGILLTSNHTLFLLFMLQLCYPPQTPPPSNPLSCPSVVVCPTKPGPQAWSEGWAMSVLPSIVCRRTLVFSQAALPSTGPILPGGWRGCCGVPVAAIQLAFDGLDPGQHCFLLRESAGRQRGWTWPPGPSPALCSHHLQPGDSAPKETGAHPSENNTSCPHGVE